MLLRSVIIALLISIYSFAAQPSFSKRDAKEIEKGIELVTELNEAFQQNGLNGISTKEMENITRKAKSLSPILRRYWFILFMEKIFNKNPSVFPKQYRVSSKNLSKDVVEFAKVAPELAKRTRKDVGEGKKASFAIVSENFCRVHLKPLGVQFLMQVNESFQKNGFNGISIEEMGDIIEEEEYFRTHPIDTLSSTLFKKAHETGLFAGFMEKVFIQNLPIVPKQYRVPLENLPKEVSRAVKMAPELAERTQKDIDEGSQITLQRIKDNIWRIRLKPVGIQFLTRLNEFFQERGFIVFSDEEIECSVETNLNHCQLIATVLEKHCVIDFVYELLTKYPAFEKKDTRMPPQSWNHYVGMIPELVHLTKKDINHRGDIDKNRIREHIENIEMRYSDAMLGHTSGG